MTYTCTRYIPTRIYTHVKIILYYLQLQCIGIQTFTRNGERMEEMSSFEHKIWSTSRQKEHYTATGLVPNSQYTCRALSVAGHKQSSTEMAPQVTFQTLSGSKD